MKKHKSVVAILLAVMMIFTMMPTMAFAAKATGWGDEYATVTDADGNTFKTERTFATSGETKGMVTATATNEKTTVVVGESDAAIPTEEDGTTTATKHFYQMAGSALVFDGDVKKTLDGTTWTQDAFAQLKSKVGVKVVAPSYVKDYNAQNPATAVVAPSEFKGWTAEIKTSEYDTTKATEDQKITVSIEFTPAGEIKGTAAAPEKFGVVADATITVKGVATTPKTAKFYFDAVGGADLQHGYYDGAAHTVVCDEVPGYTVSYEVYNPTTGKWDATSAVSITDVQEKAMKVRATFKKGTTDTQTREFDVNLVPGYGAIVGFDIDKSDDDTDCEYTVPGTEYDAASYLAVVADVQSTKSASTAEGKALIKAQNEATKKAVAANEEQIKAYFNDYFQIDAKVKKNTPYKAGLAIVGKELTEKEEEALEKKYVALLRNLGSINGEDTEPYMTATVYFNNGEYDYEVEFTKAPAGVTTYKAKKGKLPKNKTITVKAVAADGATVYYKLINGNSKISINKKTGKITIKKGLKKGTYTFKVKAYVPGVIGSDKGVDNWYEFQTVKVKIKK